jgi:hypothetical protein
MNEQKRDHRQKQAMQAPVQLALNVLAEVDSGKAQAQAKTKTSQPEFVEAPSIEAPSIEAPSIEAPSTRAPSGESREHALLRDAQAHWQAVDRLTRNLRKRARVSKRPPAGRWAKPANTQTSAQKTLWVSVESNDGSGLSSDFGPGSDRGKGHQIRSDNSAARNGTMVSSDPGLEICRHLVAALRLQHEQDQLRQANLDEKQSA